VIKRGKRALRDMGLFGLKRPFLIIWKSWGIRVCAGVFNTGLSKISRTRHYSNKPRLNIGQCYRRCYAAHTGFDTEKPMQKVYITDLILRDAHQSLIATRLRTEDMLPACAMLDDIGYWSPGCWAAQVRCLSAVSERRSVGALEQIKSRIA